MSSLKPLEVFSLHDWKQIKNTDSSPLWIKVASWLGIRHWTRAPSLGDHTWGHNQLSSRDTHVSFRLTQSWLEMALSSVNPPSSYRLKQTGNIAESGGQGGVKVSRSLCSTLCARVQSEACTCSYRQAAQAPGKLTPTSRMLVSHSGLLLPPPLAPQMDFILLNCDLEFQWQQAMRPCTWQIYLLQIFKDSYWGHYRS